MMKIGLEEAWAVLRNKGFEWQYEGRFKLVHLDETATMVGRALTATFVPKRPDLDKVLTEKGHKDGHIGGRNSWPIDMLQKRDVYVANAFSSFEGGPIIGGNLATAIYRNSGNGVVFDGSVRDIAQMETIQGFKAWVRDWHPSYNYDNMLVEINRPARIGTMTCLPGDVVLAKRGGVLCIPPVHAELVCKTGELVQLRDMFGFQRIKEGTYTPGQIDQRWTDDMEKDFSKWLNDHIDKLPVAREQVQEVLKDRTW
jgi:regulator of RNase E activity RraA